MDASKSPTPGAGVRLLSLWHLLFALVISLSTIIALTDVPQTERRISAVGLSLLLCLWYGSSAWWVQRKGRASTPYLLGFLMVGWLIWFALTDLHPAYLFVLFALFPHVFISMSMLWSGIGAVLLTALVMIRQAALFGYDMNTLLIFMSIATIAGMIVARFIEAIISESAERQRLIVTLESTRRELADAERQAGVLQERQRLAGEIHDTLAQGLTSIVMHLEAAESALADAAKVQQHLNEARTVARANLAEARRVVWGLRPEILEHQTLEQAVQQTARDWSAAQHIAAEVSVIGARAALPPERELVLLRVLQEALANITKHARAQHVSITLSYMPNAAVIDIHDDGVGFAVNRTVRSGQQGFGLLNMRQRLEQYHGTLTIESSSEGTTLVAEMPLN